MRNKGCKFHYEIIKSFLTFFGILIKINILKLFKAAKIRFESTYHCNVLFVQFTQKNNKLFLNTWLHNNFLALFRSISKMLYLPLLFSNPISSWAFLNLGIKNGSQSSRLLNHIRIDKKTPFKSSQRLEQR